MAEDRKWSVVPRSRVSTGGGMYARYHSRGQLWFSVAASRWFEGKDGVDLLCSDDGAYAVRFGDTAKFSYSASNVIFTWSHLTLPIKTRLAVYQDGDLLVIDPNGDA